MTPQRRAENLIEEAKRQKHAIFGEMAAFIREVADDAEWDHEDDLGSLISWVDAEAQTARRGWLQACAHEEAAKTVINKGLKTREGCVVPVEVLTKILSDWSPTPAEVEAYTEAYHDALGKIFVEEKNEERTLEHGRSSSE